MRKLKNLAWAFFFMVILVSGCSNIDTQTGMLKGENLIIDYPEDMKAWKAYVAEDEHHTALRFEKPGGDEGDVLRVGIFGSIHGEDGEKFLRDLAGETEREGCSQFINTSLKYPMESIYMVKYWETLCIEDSKSQRKELNLGILGNDKLYLIQRRWKTKVPEEDVNLWKSRFEEIYLCDTRIDDTPCPKTTGDEYMKLTW